jgi:succinate-semialdehyde dehydrogenase/glutarate-semialdehyde dehydrogenase
MSGGGTEVGTREKLLKVRNPADGGLIGSVHQSDASEACAAADGAAVAFEEWSRASGRTRADILLRVAALLGDRADELGLLLAKETGKRLPEAVGEIRFAAEYFRWFAEEARRPIGHIMPSEMNKRRHHTLARPAGVAVCLSPWNFPVSIQARKLAAALAAGCTVVARPSDKAPLAVAQMFELIHDAGAPPGVAKLIVGPAAELTEALLAHPSVRVVSFTGSTSVGRSILKLAAKRVVTPLMELGGDAPFIVFADCDLERAVEGAMLAKFRNNGQSCIAANRFYVESPVFAEFTRRFAARVDSMTIGDPTQAPIPDLGPLIDEERKRAINVLVAEARKLGARLINAERDELNGSFVAPALLIDVPAEARLSYEEVFGPVAAIFQFGAESEAIAAANATEMGLAAYVYTGSFDRALRLQEEIQVGILGMNNALPSVAFAPMGGWKQSGLGREGSRRGLEEFQELTYVSSELA